MPGIFINYRHADSGGFAGRLSDALIDRFGRGLVFRDIKLEPGVLFEREIEDQIAGCSVQLVVIGKSWLTMADDQGRRRLDDPDDLLSHEIASALKRPEVRVIPVLVDDARMPDADRLPASIRDLTKRNAHSLPNAYWDTGVAKLIASIEDIVGSSKRESASERQPAAIVPFEEETRHPPQPSLRLLPTKTTGWIPRSVLILSVIVATVIARDIVRFPLDRDVKADMTILAICVFIGIASIAVAARLERR